MHAADIARLYDYNCWANARLMDVVSRLTPDEFTQRGVGSYGSIRNTLVHILSAEWGWLERCGGYPRGERLKAEDFPTVESIVAVWRRIESEMRSFLDTLPDADLATDISFAFGPGPAQTATKGDLLQHAVLHAVHHRGQVAMLLRELGRTPGNFDFLFYATDHHPANMKRA